LRCWVTQLGQGMKKKYSLIGSALAVPGAVVAVHTVDAADSASLHRKTPIECKAPDAPYKNYDCLDAYLGDRSFECIVNYCRLEWGHERPPADPKAALGCRAGWPDPPATTPPFPFTRMAVWWRYIDQCHPAAR
jgi:hypothetical protein